MSAPGTPLGTPLGAAPGDLAAVEAIVRAAGTSFYRGMRVLPADRRAAMYAVYAFCREVDDIVDDEGDFAGKLPLLAAWRARIAGLYRGEADGPVTRVEIDAFKRSFAIPEGSMAEVARLFDNARETAHGFESYARQMGQAFSDNRGILEQVLAGLYQIARADKALTRAELAFLAEVARGFGLDEAAARRAGAGQVMAPPAEDPYMVLGIAASATLEEIRVRWKRLMRENHPDTLSAKGMAAEMVKKASDRVARINAAYDAIKRERKL